MNLADFAVAVIQSPNSRHSTLPKSQFSVRLLRTYSVTFDNSSRSRGQLNSTRSKPWAHAAAAVSTVERRRLRSNGAPAARSADFKRMRSQTAKFQESN